MKSEKVRSTNMPSVFISICRKDVQIANTEEFDKWDESNIYNSN